MVFIQINDVVSYRRNGNWYFSVVVAVLDIGGIQVMSGELKEPLTLDRDEIESVYREVVE